jgi:hypothetical protein
MTVLIVGAVGAAPAAAQTSADLAALAKQLRVNQEQIRDYTWRSKYVYSVNGSVRRTDIYSVRYVDGWQEKMQISSEAAEGTVRRPDGKKLSKKEREAAYAFIMDVKGQLDAYLNPLFAERAVATAAATVEGDALVLRSRDVVTTGDEVEIRYSAATRVPRSAAITTTVEGSPVSLQLEFGTLEFGPNHPERTTTRAVWQGFQLEITTENSDYEEARP